MVAVRDPRYLAGWFPAGLPYRGRTIMTDVAHIPAADPLERIQCQWCQSMNEKTALACRACGAPLDIRNLVSESGWREAPGLRDMTGVQFSSVTCPVGGSSV